MTAGRCPNGHDSTESDYCDVCGARLQPADPPGEQARTSSPPASGQEGPQSPARVPCPRCGTLNTESDKFCEGCGLDFASPAPASATLPATATGWVAIVTADRSYYERTDPGDIEFPTHCPERRIPLTAAEHATIGRRSSSKPNKPDIDLAGPPEDVGVSHDHATLTLAPDGSWLITDDGSTNGTFRNDDEIPISPGEPILLGEGDRIHVGAWTTITLARALPDGA